MLSVTGSGGSQRAPSASYMTSTSGTACRTERWAICSRQQTQRTTFQKSAQVIFPACPYKRLSGRLRCAFTSNHSVMRSHGNSKSQDISSGIRDAETFDGRWPVAAEETAILAAACRTSHNSKSQRCYYIPSISVNVNNADIYPFISDRCRATFELSVFWVQASLHVMHTVVL